MKIVIQTQHRENYAFDENGNLGTGENAYWKFKRGDTVVTNIRHYDSLLQTKNSLQDVINGIDGQITNDFVAMDIRRALHYLGEITGEITTDDLLANIFGKFCIGK